MRAWIAVCVALAPIGAWAGVIVEQVSSLVIETEAPLRSGDVLLSYGKAGRQVEIADALAFRLAEAAQLPAAPLQLDIGRGDSTLTVQLPFGVADIQLRADSALSPAARLDQAWVDAIAAEDWPLTRRLRDQALQEWRGIELDFARLRGAKALFSERAFADCVDWIETQQTQVERPLLRAQLLEQQNHCIGYSDSGDWRRGAAALDQASELLVEAAPESLLKARIDALRAQILSFSDAPRARVDVQAAIASGLASCGRCEGVGVMYQQAGDVYANLNAYREAEAAYQESVEYARALKADPDSLAARLRPLARTLRVMGRWDEAWAVASEALDEMQRSSMPASAQVPFLNGLGAIAANRGDFQRAAEQFRAALELGAQSAPHSLELGNARANLGWTLLQLGELAAAEVELRQALAVVSDYDDGIQRAVTLGMLADLEIRRGNDDRALAQLDEIGAIHERVNADAFDHALVLIQRAILLERMGRGSADTWQRAMQIVDLQPADSVLRAEPLIERGYADLRLGDVQTSLAGIEQAIEILQQHAPDGLTMARAQHGAGMAELSLGQLQSAQEHLSRALAIRSRDVPQSATHAESLHAAARIAAARGEQEIARAQYCLASEMLDRASLRVGGDSLAQARFRSLYTTIYRDCVEAQAAANQPELAFAALERFRARGFRAALEASRFRGQPIFEAIAFNHDQEEQAIARANDTSLSIELRREARKQAAAIGVQRLALLAELSEQVPASAAVELTSYQQRLARGEALLSFSTGEQRAIAFLLTRDQLRMVSVDIDLPTLAAEIDGLRLLLSPAAAEKDWQAGSARLHAQLLGPFATELRSIQILRIAPDGPLHLLPFAALWDANQDRYLLASHQLIMADGLAPATARSSVRQRRLLAVGVSQAPDESTSAISADAGLRRGLSALPAARLEIESLASRSGTRRLLDIEATEAAVRQSLSAVDDLHFAVHAVHDPAHTMDSALLLYPGTGTPGDDGSLSLREIIAELRVPHGLVVLSACETAQGRSFEGEGPLSFARAFSIAGAAATVASLWPVNDQATAQLMGHFYDLRDLGLRPAQALQRAMLELANGDLSETRQGTDAQRGVGGIAPAGSAPSHSHPYFWASFQIWSAWESNASGVAHR